MNTLDIVLIGIIVAATGIGFLRGIVSMIGAFVATFAAAFGASYVQALASGAIDNLPDNVQGSMNTILFFVAFGVIWFGVNLVVKMIDLATSIPIVGGMKRTLGAVLGLLQGMLVVGVLCVALRAFDISDGLNTLFEESQLADLAIKGSFFVIGLMPKEYREMATLIKTVK